MGGDISFGDYSWDGNDDPADQTNDSGATTRTDGPETPFGVKVYCGLNAIVLAFLAFVSLGILVGGPQGFLVGLLLLALEAGAVWVLRGLWRLDDLAWTLNWLLLIGLGFASVLGGLLFGVIVPVVWGGYFYHHSDLFKGL